MIKIILFLSLFPSIFLMTAFHPIMIMIMVIAQTVLICLMIWLMAPTSWFAYILFLIFIGGLMVLFIYTTSLAANEKFNFNMIISNSQTYLVTALLTLTAASTLFFSFPAHSVVNFNTQMSSIFSSFISPLTLIIMTYLLVTLIVAVKISNKLEAPLRNMIKTK